MMVVSHSTRSRSPVTPLRSDSSRAPRVISRNEPVYDDDRLVADLTTVPIPPSVRQGSVPSAECEWRRIRQEDRRQPIGAAVARPMVYFLSIRSNAVGILQHLVALEKSPQYWLAIGRNT